MGKHDAAQALRPAVFLDRDGTLNREFVRDDRPYPPARLEEFELYPGVPEACDRLARAGFVLVVATNQPDVGRGTRDRALVEAMHAKLRQSIPAIALVQACFHAGAEHGQPCACRKPAPGLLQDAAHRLGLDLARSWMVGDRWRDVDCGRAAGCRTVFIDRGYAEALRARPDFAVRDLGEAAGIILAHP
jgi:D-glycero-D-manno-heptose 1,7-bisphosphate phosphatase